MKVKCYFSLGIYLLVSKTNAQAPKTPVLLGALYQDGSLDERRAVRMGLARASELNPKMSFKLKERNVTSDPRVKTCMLAKMGVTAIISVVKDADVDFAIGFVAEGFHLPILQVRQQPSLASYRNKYIFSPLPVPHLLLDALVYYLNRNRILRYIVIYEDEPARANAAQSFSYVMKEDNYNGFCSNTILKIEVQANGSISDMTLRQTSANITRLIRRNDFVKLETLIVFARFSVAKQLMNNLHTGSPLNHLHWILPSYNQISVKEIISLQKFFCCTITIFDQYIDVESELVKRFKQSWNRNLLRDCSDCRPKEADEIPLFAYHIADGVQHLSETLLHLQKEFYYPAPLQLDCSPGSIWEGGIQITEKMKQINTTGMLSTISLNENGFNKLANFAIKTKRSGIGKTFKTEAIWNVNSSKEMEVGEAIEIHDVKFRVVTVVEPPFVIEEKVGNFTGFAIEIFQKLAEKYEFRYSIYKVPDGKYGSMMKNNSWNGMIGELISGPADIAVAAMTITADRERVVDFPKRYMDYSVGIAIRRPLASSSIFSFVKPFHSSVWFCIALCLILVVVIVYFLNQVSPSRTSRQKRCDKRNELDSVFWVTYSSLMQQGLELRTTSLPARVAIGFWWLFTLVVVSSYTANLAAFLTVERLDLPIRSFKDLVNQNDIAYGTVPHTSIFDYILAKGKEASNEDSQFKKMALMVNSTKDRFPNAMEGFALAKKENQAFLWDVAVIEYEVLNHETCAITMVGDSIYDKGYGFALQHGSPYRDTFTHGILALQESGDIEKLRQKYWQKSGGCDLNREGATTKATERTLDNFTGIFFMLAGGLVLACFVAVAEIAVNVGKGKQEAKSTENDETTGNKKSISSLKMEIADDPDNATLIQTPGGKNTIYQQKHRKVSVLSKVATVKKRPPHNIKKASLKQLPRRKLSRLQNEPKDLKSFPIVSKPSLICDLSKLSPMEGHKQSGKQDYDGKSFQYKLLNGSLGRQMDNVAFSTIPRVNLSYSLEKVFAPPPQYNTVSRSRFGNDMTTLRFPKFDLTSENHSFLQRFKDQEFVKHNDQSLSYGKSKGKIERLTPYAPLSSCDETPPLLKKSSV